MNRLYLMVQAAIDLAMRPFCWLVGHSWYGGYCALCSKGRE